MLAAEEEGDDGIVDGVTTAAAAARVGLGEDKGRVEAGMWEVRRHGVGGIVEG